ncbi:MAG: polyhydroxyalkanoate synthesis repressor PhaR [Alphaproteobacteria bacterium]|nr:polyhydroxyalkanoate synthesis repressor PhaR [Alphaproteobacteria bacterium]
MAGRSGAKKAAAVEGAPIAIKKYANRRLYNTGSSSYVTLDDLCQMVKAGNDFLVVDAKSGEDITRSVLTQIILEEEGKGQNLLPIRFLRKIISFYGDNLQTVLSPYLELSMENFSRNQERMRGYLDQTFTGLFPFPGFDEMARQNMAMMERTMTMFKSRQGEEGGEGALPEAEAGAGASLKERLDAMQRQLDDLARKAKGTQED